MIALFKGLIPGGLLAWIVSSVMGRGGGFLDIHQLAVGGVEFYWSWPLFIGGTGLAAFVFATTK